eukprot:gnl/MRDRNA2_/MRDRNA2_70081_c0_seq3.p1 gnl/MRDRNA2_/MRDRNA2_70081_c0~~gnl/MRDRNA2_/MRDRNA2_70081_c0_seq3.p1  ORF type:complete len:443 (+),score=64.25 gnl/MRDRNA2_/MRDRNA2_70081_c0_seq3:76-1404(+)
MVSRRLSVVVLHLICLLRCESRDLHDSESLPYTSANYPDSGNLACAGPHKSVTRYVCDPNGIMSTAGRDRVAQKLAALEVEPKFPCGTGPDRGFQLGVALVERIDLNREGIEEFSRNIFNRWGLGYRECNNGILLVLARGDRKNYVKTAQGARKVLTDHHAADVLASLRPELRSEKYDDAIEKAVDRIINEALVNGSPPLFYRLNDACFGFPAWLLENPFIIFLAFGTLSFVAYYSYKEQRKQQFVTKLRSLQDARSKARIMASKSLNCSKIPCPICLEELTPPHFNQPPLDFKDSHVEHGVELLMCGHVFHQKCIEKWLTKSDSCPICRTRKPRIAAQSRSTNQKKAQRPSVATPDDTFWSFAFQNLTDNYDDVEGVRSTRNRMRRSETDWFLYYNNVCAEEQEAARQAAAAAAAQRSDSGSSSGWGGGDCDGGGGAGGDW